MDIMGIFTKIGDSVVYSFPTHGYDADQRNAATYLKQGQVYKVFDIRIG